MSIKRLHMTYCESNAAYHIWLCVLNILFPCF